MILAIISGAVCLAVATMMYTPKMRSFRLYRPVAFIFIFEGLWILLDYIFEQFIPDNEFMPVIHYAGIIILCVYLLIKMFFTSKRKLVNKDKR